RRRRRRASGTRPSCTRSASAGPPRRVVTRFDALGGTAVGLALAALFLVETRAPLRRRVRPRAERLATNALVALGAALVVRLALVPVGVVVAGAAERAGVGLLHWLPVPAGLAWPAGLLDRKSTRLNSS